MLLVNCYQTGYRRLPPRLLESDMKKFQVFVLTGLGREIRTCKITKGNSDRKNMQKKTGEILVSYDPEIWKTDRDLMLLFHA